MILAAQDENPNRAAQLLREPGILLSLLLHLLLLALVLWLLRQPMRPETTAPPVVAVDIVRLGAVTAAPGAARKSPLLLRSTAPTVKQEASNPTKAQGVGKSTTPLPLDNIDAKLRALAKLRQPQTDPRLLAHNGLSNIDAGEAANGTDATYSVRDFVRAEIERHWNLDLAQLGNHNFSIPLHIILKRDGTILRAEVVPSPRFRDDKVYRFIAISARNAALLSSPLKLPPGDYEPVMDMVLNFNPREVLR
ncbi:MAG TPA: hypothetical protein VIJ72_07110 [Rhizomicrobium sp.]